MIVPIMLVLFFLLVLLGVPVFMVLLFSSLIGLLMWGGIPLELVAQRMFAGIDQFVLIAIPFFVLTGIVMEASGLAKRLLDFSTIFVGKIRGGLAIVNVIGSMFFAGVTGAASADTASVGSILIPGMVQKGYDEDYSIVVTITSSTIGVIIPPSIPMVIYGVLTDSSISELFLAGMIPGILIGLGLISVSYYYAVKRNYPREELHSFQELKSMFLSGIAPLMVIVIIFGGIFGGVFTPTEAAVVAASYCLFISVVVYKKLKIRDLGRLFAKTGVMSSIVALLIAASNIFSWILATRQVPVRIQAMIFSITDDPLFILLIIALIYLIIGCFIDLTPAMIILVPILLPLVKSAGISVIHFGMVTVMALAIGLYTPPVGVCLGVALSICDTPILKVIKALIPFFLVMVLTLLTVILFPQLALFLLN